MQILYIRNQSEGIYLHRHQHASILVPVQERVLSISRLRILNVGPAFHEVLVTHDLGQLARHGTVHILDDIEVCREKDIKVPLVDLDV